MIISSIYIVYIQYAHYNYSLHTEILKYNVYNQVLFTFNFSWDMIL